MSSGSQVTARAARYLGLVLAPVATLAAGRAAADPKIDKADQLFAEGKALLDSNLLQACDKFKESLDYNPEAIGTLLNVALCDEKLGRIASAVARFSEARDRAKEHGFVEHVRAAEQHIAALESGVPHLAIKLTEIAPETKIILDDRIVALGDLGDVPVDPGERDLVVSAPGRLPYRTRLVVARAEHRDVVVPALARAITVTSSRRRIAQITTFAGAGAIATGVGLGLYGRQLHHDQFDNGECMHTGTGDLCSRTGQNRTNRARTLGNVGTAVGLVGVAVTGLGIYLWRRWPAPTEADKKLAIVPALGPDHLGIAALGRF